MLATVVLGLSSCSEPPAPVTAPSSEKSSSTPPSSTASTPSCPQTGFDCDFQNRFAAAQKYVQNRPGTVGIVVRDRQSGAVWRNDQAGTLVWTASTVKLGMTIDLFRRQRAGTITLGQADRSLIQQMLHSSDDNAADALWKKFGRDDYAKRFPEYGLTGITFVPKFDRYWGFMKCTPDDLDRMINYLLTEVPADTKAWILNEMRTVDPNQQWGVWGAGPAGKPGNKDGWSEEDTGWVMNTVGFVGPDERYTLSIMNSLNGKGGYEEGKATLNKVAEIIFSGRF
ncbi:tat pathway signal sequence [Pseudonocardiaceae bacterium YIM PH 21723]|nr:tat pathway signal sequence [Pseudonocardiaceae bacterium YIM PH 21723]